MSDWDPDQYRRFAAERSQPFWDLIDSLDATTIGRMVDLGCGDGELSVQAAARLGAGALVGVESSPAMLERTIGLVPPEHTDLSFERGDLATWTTTDPAHRGWDLVLANASLQWVPDHEEVLRRWTQALAPRGQLAVQVPANGTHASHVVANEVGATAPFLEAMGGEVPPDPSASNVLAPEEYARILFELGYETQQVTLRVYPHVLRSSSDVVEWVRGTTLNRFFQRLPADLHEPFVAAYRTALLRRIGDVAPYFYPFKRILFVVRRP
jgi:trans-aconitate 2-methyltransferase